MTLRLFWFLVGAGTATWWIKSPHIHSHAQATLAYPSQDKRQQEDSNEEPQVLVKTWSWGKNSGWSERAQWGDWDTLWRRSERSTQQWGDQEKPFFTDDEKARMRAIGKQASEAVRFCSFFFLPRHGLTVWTKCCNR